MEKRFFILFIFSTFIIFYFTFGLPVFNPFNIAWLLKGADPANQYLGWAFFQQESWHFPLGAMENFNLSQRTSVALTDSLPLFAFLFKLFPLPDVFQYFGIFIFISIFLNGIFAFLILKLFEKNSALCFLASLFFMLAPPFLFRLNVHVALAAHWVILCSIYFYLKNTPFYFWIIILLITSFIHPYLLAMILALFIFKLIFSQEKLPKRLFYFLLAFFIIFCCTYSCGYFVAEASLGDEGFGKNNAMNLISFLDHHFLTPSLFLPVFIVSTFNSFEDGTQYLGCGILFLNVLAVFCYLKNKSKYNNLLGHHPKGLVLIAFLLALFAMASPIYFLNTPLVSLPIYQTFPFLQISSMFRASGRFGWVLFYLIYCVTFFILFRTFKKQSLFLILLFALLIQMIDLTPKIKYIHDENQQIRSLFFPEELKNAARHKTQLVMLTHTMPLKTKDGQYKADYYYYTGLATYMAYFAQQNHLKANYAHSNRRNFEKQYLFDQQQWQDLKQGQAQKKTLYVFFNDITAEDFSLLPLSVQNQLIRLPNFPYVLYSP